MRGKYRNGARLQFRSKVRHGRSIVRLLWTALFLPKRGGGDMTDRSGCERETYRNSKKEGGKFVGRERLLSWRKEFGLWRSLAEEKK